MSAGNKFGIRFNFIITLSYPVLMPGITEGPVEFSSGHTVHSHQTVVLSPSNAKHWWEPPGAVITWTISA